MFKPADPTHSPHALSGLLDQGIREFNIGRYWHAHEDWEKAWLRLTGAEKTALQGMIQAAASFYLLEKGRVRPATSLAASALGKFGSAGGREIARENRVDVPGLVELLREIAGEVPSIGAAACAPGASTSADRAVDWLRRAKALRAHRPRGLPVTGNSRRVDSTQLGPHPDLEERVRRVLGFKHEPRIPEEDRARFAALDEFVRGTGLPVVLDSGCGTGASSERLLRLHPGALVVGVDRSPHRLGKAVSRLVGSRRSESGERSAVPALELASDVQVFGERLVIARFELSRFWWLVSRSGWKISKNCVLYPNPWPKPNALRRRWHGHEIFPVLIRLAPELELRSNWLTYLEEFHGAYRTVTGRDGVLEMLGPAELKEPLTPFERKYRDSGHDLWRWRVSPSPISG